MLIIVDLLYHVHFAPASTSNGDGRVRHAATIRPAGQLLWLKISVAKAARPGPTTNGGFCHGDLC